MEYFDKINEEIFDKFAKRIKKQIKAQIGEISEKDLDLDWAWLEEKLLIAAMIGFDDESELTEFAGEEDINPFEMTFDEAIFYFAEKNPVLYEHIQEITDEVKNRMFWIKKSNDLSITRSLIQNLIIALEDGQIYKQWVEASEDVLRVSGFGNNAWYTKLIWRNAMHSSYNHGASVFQESNKENKPYGFYDSIEDARRSSICGQLDGKCYPLDHEFWQLYLPPNHHNCRSKRIALSKEDLKEYEIKARTVIPESIKTLDEKMGSFRGSYTDGLKKAVKTKEKEIKKAREKLVQLKLI